MNRQFVRWSAMLIVAAAALSSVLTALVVYAVITQGTFAIGSESPGIPNTGDTTIPQVVAHANPSVVSIIVSQNISALERRYGYRDPYGEAMGPTGSDDVEIGGGSGFVVNDGYIVTNKHVVSLPDADYTVLTNDGKKHPGTVVYRDTEKDVAILKISGTYPALSLGNSDTVQIGESVIAIGNALSEFQNTVSVGVISGLDRSIRAIDPVEGSIEELDQVIQTDAAINRGNSGGPLLDAAGKVIGMNVAVSANAENIGFAIPVNEIRNVLQHVR